MRGHLFKQTNIHHHMLPDVDYRNQAIWLKYAEMEMKNKFVNHARNVWDRTVTIHPRIDVFW